jgi:hypothetical protein
MADITKCSVENCYQKEKCYRHIAPNGLWQSWMDYRQGIDPKSPCPDFWNINEQRKSNGSLY